MIIETKMEIPKISAVIPAYNSRYLRDALKSIYVQTFKDFEVIVVDDGSPGTGIKDICDDFPGVRYIWQANAGPSVARNLGIKEAKGALIAFLDDDDIWLPDKLAKQIAVYESCSDKDALGLIYTGQYMFDEDTIFGAKVDSANGLVYPYLLFGQFIGTCSSVLVRKSVFDECGDFDNDLICTQDFELFLRISRTKMVYSIDEPLIMYRTRPDQISKDPALNNREDLLVLSKQKPFISSDLFKRVSDFNRQLRGERYKWRAYDALFYRDDCVDFRRCFWKWIVESRKLPSLPSVAYFLCSFFPGKFASRLAGIKKRSTGPAREPEVSRQDVMSRDFTWMGIPRGELTVADFPGLQSR